MVTVEFNNDERTISEKLRDIVLRGMKEYAGVRNEPISMAFDRNMACIADTEDQNKSRFHAFLSGAAFGLIFLETQDNTSFELTVARAERLLKVVWAQAYDIALIEERVALKQRGPELG